MMNLINYFIFPLAQNEAAAEERKRQEYEEWLKSQEKEQQKLEYECSVKYEENKQELRQQQEEQQLILQQHHQGPIV